MDCLVTTNLPETPVPALIRADCRKITQLAHKGAQKATESAETIEQLHAKIGQLTMETDFLERELERIHGPRGKKW